MTIYTTGTVAVTNGGTTLTGSGTAWVANVKPGDLLRLPDGRTYFVAAVASDTSLTFAPAYEGTTVASGGAYVASPVSGRLVPLYDEVAAWNALTGAYVTGPLAGRFGSGSAAAPGVAFADQTNLGLFRAGASILALTVNGTERMRWTATGAQLTGLLTGTAVTQSTTDTTAGRLVKVGDAAPTVLSGLGTLATQAANAVAITGGTATLSGLTLSGQTLTVGGNAIGGSNIVVADDAAGLFPFPTGKQGGFAFIGQYGSILGRMALVSFRSGTATIEKSTGWSTVGGSVDVVATDVTGTTGTDGKITIGLAAGGLRLENRLGNSLSFFCTYL